MKAIFADQPIDSRLFWRLCVALCLPGLALRLPTLSNNKLELFE